jgi:hypothetical protein
VRIIGNRARDIEGPASPIGRIDASRRLSQHTARGRKSAGPATGARWLHESTKRNCGDGGLICVYEGRKDPAMDSDNIRVIQTVIKDHLEELKPEDRARLQKSFKSVCPAFC